MLRDKRGLEKGINAQYKSMPQTLTNFNKSKEQIILIFHLLMTWELNIKK